MSPPVIIVVGCVCEGRSHLPSHNPVPSLPHDHPLVPAHIQDQIHIGLKKSEQLITQAGYELQWSYVTPEKGMDQFVEYLTTRKPAGVVFGYGVRGVKELSPLFEDLVNAVVEKAPGAKLMFNTSPEDSVEHIKRWVPIK